MSLLARLPRLPLIVLGLIVAACVVGPLFMPGAASAMDLLNTYAPPSFASGHVLGTDPLGRDVLARLLQAGRVSLAVGLAATLASALIGVTYGAVAGYRGGRTDLAMMRLVDIVYALPFMFFVIVLMVVIGRHVWLIFVAIAAVEWLTMARIVRGQTVSLKQMDFIRAAKAMGLTDGVIIRRHILPNLATPVIVFATLSIPQAIMIESFLSFLGLGVQEPLTSWGSMIKQGVADMEFAPWLLIAPSVALAVTLICLSVLGDGLRDELDKRLSLEP